MLGKDVIFICWIVNTIIILGILYYVNFTINKKKHVKWWFLLWIIITIICYGVR